MVDEDMGPELPGDHLESAVDRTGSTLFHVDSHVDMLTLGGTYECTFKERG